MNNLIGKNLGRYHIIEPLGQGGMASVFKAYDTNLERHVAIKIIRTDIDGGTDSEFLKRFQREAKSLAQLDHPFILKVLDYGEEGGVPYLVMPYLEGGTLKEKMGKPMPYGECAVLLAPIARALEYAHKRNIIHRDVKPANILISQSGAPILSDFGIAKILSQSGSTQLTGAGVGIGTPDYMAPEQWTGTADPRTDIYSLGVVLYQMVTGRLPFSADTPAAVLIKHLRDPLPRPRTFVDNLPEVVEQVLFKALAKEPENRFQTMGEFAATLERLERSDETVMGKSAIDFETVRSVDVSASGTVIAKAPGAPKKKMGTGTIALIAVGVLVVLGIICVVLGGGTYAASRWLSPSQIGATVPAVIIDNPDTTPTKESILGQPTQPELPLNPTVPTVSNNTPFTTIEGFPNDIPLLTDNNGDLSKTTSQGMNIYTFSSNMPYDQIVEFFKSGMAQNGWTVLSETTQAGQQSWNFTKGQDQNRMTMINLIGEGDVTQISIMEIAQ
jgi:serine/threonine protein kinase